MKNQIWTSLRHAVPAVLLIAALLNGDALAHRAPDKANLHSNSFEDDDIFPPLVPIRYGSQDIVLFKTYSAPTPDGRFTIVQAEEVCRFTNIRIPVYQIEEFYYNLDPKYFLSCETYINDKRHLLSFISFITLSTESIPTSPDLVNLKSFAASLTAAAIIDSRPSDEFVETEEPNFISRYTSTRDLRLGSIITHGSTGQGLYGCSGDLDPMEKSFNKSNDDCLSDEPIDVIYSFFAELRDE
jgi:hypothetical protein